MRLMTLAKNGKKGRFSIKSQLLYQLSYRGNRAAILRTKGRERQAVCAEF